MAHISPSKLSREYVYLVPDIRIRPFVSASKGRFTIVSYEGVSESELKPIQWKTARKTSAFHLGQLIARSNEEGVWAFRLNLYGVREVHLPKDRTKLVKAFLTDVEACVQAALKVVSTEPNTVQHFHFEYEFSLVTDEAEYIPASKAE